MNIWFSTIFVILNVAFQVTESYKISLYKKSEDCKILYVDFSGDSNEENIQFYSQLKNEAWNTKDIWLISILELTVSKVVLQEIKKLYQNPICKTLQFHSCSFSDDSFDYHRNSIKALSLDKNFKKHRFLSGKNPESVPYLPNSLCNEKLADDEIYQKILPKRENLQLSSISFDSCTFTENSLEIVLKTLPISIKSFIFDGNNIYSEKISEILSANCEMFSALNLIVFCELREIDKKQIEKHWINTDIAIHFEVQCFESECKCKK